MMAQLISQDYGKSCVRLSRVTRHNDRHDFVELTADVALEGDFGAAYTDADNRAVIPTDTIKNTVYALAHEHGVESIESFALLLAGHFLGKFSHVSAARVSVDQRPWVRMESDHGAHPHSFLAAGAERWWCRAEIFRQAKSLQSGFRGLEVLKTTNSAFTGFLRDEYTTLAETDDRIFATTIEAGWPCNDVEADWPTARQTVRQAMLRVFAERFSPSVQATLFEMADAAMTACPLIDEITITMPNQHHLLANLEPFGLANENATFVPTSEPFGRISATIERGETRVRRD